MKNSFINKLLTASYKNRFYLLFIALILNFILPTLLRFPVLDAGLRIFSTAILVLSGVNFLEKSKIKLREAWLILGLFIIMSLVISEQHHESIIYYHIHNGLKCLFFIILTSSVIKQISSTHEVTKDVILGSFCGYILIGIISYLMFVSLGLYIPNAFSGLSSNLLERKAQLFYFTFTTLTTLGFGDILPTHMLTQRLAVLTAIIGQFYIAIVVAILISRYIQYNRK
ncbi:MAG TPA: ion channel [Flavobacterium sp.]|nr:ion channel [Flavobacterium sp.]